MGRWTRRGNKDGNHKPIIAAILEAGWTVIELDAAVWSVVEGPEGNAVTKEAGVSDALCLRVGDACLIEVKDRDAATGGQQAARELRQRAFLAWCASLGVRGAIVESPEEALAALDGPEALAAWRKQAQQCVCGHPRSAHTGVAGCHGITGFCRCGAFREPTTAKTKRTKEPRAKRARKPRPSYTPPRDVKHPCPKCGARDSTVSARVACAVCLSDDIFSAPTA